MPDLLPVDQTGSIAATDAPLPPGSPLQPPTPQRPAMGPPQDPMQQIMGMLGQPSAQPPAPPPPMGNQEPPTPGQPQTPSMPGVATQDGAGSNPRSIQQQKLQQHMAELKQQIEQVQSRIKALMSPDAVANQLPGGGKQKPSDFLRDAMYNFAQLNLRNPIYGSLKGQDYKPIQQQRFEQAITQHNAQLQNLTLIDKSLNEQMASDQYMANQSRQEQQERDKVQQYEDTNQIKLQQMQAKAKQDAVMNKFRAALNAANVGLKGAQQEYTASRQEMLDTFGGNKADVLAWYLKNHADDPDVVQQYEKIKQDLYNQKETDSPAKQLQRLKLTRLMGAADITPYQETTLGTPAIAGTTVFEPGVKYIDTSKISDNEERSIVADGARKAGVPLVTDKTVAQGLKKIDESKMGIYSIMNDITSSLPKDPAGRISGQYLSANLDKLAQTNQGIQAAYNSWRTQAIGTLQALAGGMGSGLRINRSEIEQAMKDDIPQSTDTVQVAQRQMSHIMTLLSHHESMNLSSDRSLLNPSAPSSGIAYTPPTTAKPSQSSKSSSIAPPAPPVKPKKKLNELFEPVVQ